MDGGVDAEFIQFAQRSLLILLEILHLVGMRELLQIYLFAILVVMQARQLHPICFVGQNDLFCLLAFVEIHQQWQTRLVYDHDPSRQEHLQNPFSLLPLYVDIDFFLPRQCVVS